MSDTHDDGLIRFGAGTVRPRAARHRDALRAAPPRARPQKYGKWRALALTSVYVLFGLHIAHWQLRGATLAPLELNEVMYTLELGIVTAGFLLMLTLFVATAFVGRFFCSWACHILALEDLCSWLLAKLHIRPRQVRSRLLLLVPPAALFYMFAWPQITRIAQGRPAPRWRILGDEDGWASFVTNDFWRNLPDPWVAGLTFVVCGFAIVYFLGTRSFCFYACPYGAAFALADRFAPGRIKLTGDCEQCGICTGVCSSGVRVHEEIARFGKVVDVNCMKDLDCVSACPQEALGFGFTRPSPGDSFSPTGRRRLKSDFTLPEEVALGAVFVAVLVVFRGLYTVVPFLMTLGLAGIVASLSLQSVRLVTRPDVRLIPFRLKQAGRLTGAGIVFAAGMIAFGLFFAHSAFIRYHEIRGQGAFDTVKAAVAQPGTPLPSVEGRTAVRHLTAAYAWGLFRPLVRDHQLASLHLRGEDPALAEPYLRRIVSHDQQDTDSRRALARLLATTGRLEEAEVEIRAALAADPASTESAAGHALLGRLLTARGESAAALDSFRSAVALDDSAVPALMALGELLAQDGNFAEAAVAFRSVTVVQEDLAVAHYNLGAALASADDLRGAIAAYERLLELTPDDVETLTNLGFLHARLGEHAAATARFERVIELQPDLARPHFNLARLYEASGDTTLAERHYGLAAKHDPQYAQSQPDPP